ncbi:ATP-grasp domain-containing protein [Mesorhizobium sp. INR15]|uniref:carboxylate--amine ligase n=1 Tax=Mesorhizobium sp. INR15 TaxID=2654248 RepID=UPI001896788A|nr:ATP-grasp domain-containing protein [Mesorhizobium sp. INR15]QPC89738.1 ATP-grasp domain-containing protein [Mesorhizobium sp. INR15]
MGSSGAVLLGGAHGSLALARSLGAQKVPVAYITNDSPLPGWSRCVGTTIRWPGTRDDNALAFLLEAAQTHQLQGWLLVPASDPEVRLVSENLAALSSIYRIVLPGWDALQWACDKPLLYKRAADLGLAIPKTYDIAPSLDQADIPELTFPVVLKPHMGGGNSRIAKAKVVRADDAASFLSAYRDAAGQIGGENVVVQELIPGGGESQFSYAALWSEGKPVAEFTVRRTRQFPVDFGYTSTFVEVVDEPRAVIAARALLASIGHSGLVEVEFKHDSRDGTLKLLDVNPRPWSWFGLCASAGVDLGGMLWETANGRASSASAPRLGTAWMYLARDAISSMRLMLRGGLGLMAYLRSFASVRSWAAFAWNDPLPGLIDLPLTAWRVLTKRLLKKIISRR